MNEPDPDFRQIRKAYLELRAANGGLIAAIKEHEDFCGDKWDAELMAAIAINQIRKDPVLIASAIREYLCSTSSDESPRNFLSIKRLP